VDATLIRPAHLLKLDGIRLAGDGSEPLQHTNAARADSGEQEGDGRKS